MNDRVRQIVDAALEGDYVRTEGLFKQEMSQRVSDYLDNQKSNIAQNYFEEEVKPLTKTQNKNKEIIVHGMKTNEEDFKKRYGKDYKSVMIATATKLAKNEEKTK